MKFLQFAGVSENAEWNNESNKSESLKKISKEINPINWIAFLGIKDLVLTLYKTFKIIRDVFLI